MCATICKISHNNGNQNQVHSILNSIDSSEFIARLRVKARNLLYFNRVQYNKNNSEKSICHIGMCVYLVSAITTSKALCTVCALHHLPITTGYCNNVFFKIYSKNCFFFSSHSRCSLKAQTISRMQSRVTLKKVHCNS